MRPNTFESDQHENGLRVYLRSARKYGEASFHSPKAYSAAFWPELLQTLHEDGLIKASWYRKPNHGRWGRRLHSGHASVPELGTLELRKLPLDKVYPLVRRYTEFLSADVGQFAQRHNPRVFGWVKDRQFVIKCPWCLAEHRHGTQGVPGHRGAHCRLKLRNRWQYYIHASESILIETIREALPDPRARQRMLVALPKSLPLSAQDYLDGHMPGWRQSPLRA
jgi:hypothetical protein